MLQRLKAAQDQGVDVNGLWIQDWAGIKKTSFGQRLFWNWKLNPQRYPGIDIYFGYVFVLILVNVVS